MNKINDKNSINFLRSDTQQKIIAFANEVGTSPGALLNTLIDDEIERHRLLKIFNELNKEDPKATVPTVQITVICKKHLSVLNHQSESFAIRKAIESLYADLLDQKIIFVNIRKGDIVKSKILKTTRVDYYWYGGILAKNIAMCFGTLDIYLWHDLLHPFSEIVFVGMPTNVEVCYQVFLHLYQLFKNLKLLIKKIQATGVVEMRRMKKQTVICVNLLKNLITPRLTLKMTNITNSYMIMLMKNLHMQYMIKPVISFS